MKSIYLLHHLISNALERHHAREAIEYLDQSVSYSQLADQVFKFGQALIANDIQSNERVSIYLEKSIEFVVACFGSSCAANIFIPINPILKKDQVLHILKDSQSQVLVTSFSRLKTLENVIDDQLALKIIIVVDGPEEPDWKEKYRARNISVISWQTLVKVHGVTIDFYCDSEFSSRSAIDTDAVSIFYTSGSTGKPKGVVLSHRNMVFGAKNVASYLENNQEDVLLAALPLSFDAGFSQLTTAFFSCAKVILLNYLLPKDILNIVVKKKVTGLTGVPPLWMQLVDLAWPKDVTEHLRYFANTGGKMPVEILKKLRAHFPKTKPYLMYGLTESFRSTFLPPEEIDRRVHSIGKAIPNAEILVLRPDGTCCEPNEPGELVHRGALVGLGYWNDTVKTSEKYKPIPISAHVRPLEISISELGVFSGDIVKKDEEGFLYFIGRSDEMIKTSGYRISPTEIEEIIYDSGLAEEVAVFPVEHLTLGHAIIAVIKVKSLENEEKNISLVLDVCKEKLPLYMIPQKIFFTLQSLPRNQNGKIDRKNLSKSDQYAGLFLKG
ncbi:MAG: acyl-CoA ligase (AMP-forming), exosortase A system-associated [Bdellovibrionaceae bacterium]|nr:acyl-CoA ligase (AMP-forming), exosortase A system-associated [Pseudobdellovibrionaceae bacterium]